MSPVRSLQYLDNNKLASVSYNSIQIWNIDSGECIKTLTGHSTYITSLEHLNENKIASGSEEEIKIWNFDTGACIRTFITGYSSRVIYLQMLNNKRLASGSHCGQIQIWNVMKATGCLWRDNVYALQLLGNNRLASGSAGAIQIWNYEIGREIIELGGHSGGVYTLQLLTKNRIASGSEDKTIKIWDIDTGTCIRTLTVQRRSRSCNVAKIFGQ